MKRVSDFLGKPVLSLYESVTVGIVKDVIFDKSFKKLKWVVLFSENEFEEEQIVNVTDIFSFGEGAIVIKNNACIEMNNTTMDEPNNPINNRVYTAQGRYVGTVEDVEIDEKNNIVGICLSDKSTFDLGKVVTSGKDAMIIQEEGKEIRLANFRKRGVPLSTTSRQKVEIMQEEEVEISDEENNTVGEDETAQSYIEGDQKETPQGTIVTPIKQIRKRVILEENSMPKKATTNDNFLLNRKVEKNIYSFNNELIIRKNARVTDKVILIAKTHSKLRELTLYSK